MKIGLISDTHGSVPAIRQAVISAGPVDIWLHAGDYSRDANILRVFTGLEVCAVRGNCDGSIVDAKYDEFVEFGGKKIWLTHGHKYNVSYDLSELVWWGKKFAVDIVVFGHTHVPQVFSQDGLLVINPGSTSMPRRGSNYSCAVLEISDEAAVEFINLNDNNK